MEDAWTPTCHHLAGELVNHARHVRLVGLPGTVHVEIPQPHDVQIRMIRDSLSVEVLHDPLRESVDIGRTTGILERKRTPRGRGPVGVGPVRRSARRPHQPRAGVACHLDQGLERLHVVDEHLRLIIDGGVGDGRLVKDDVGLELACEPMHVDIVEGSRDHRAGKGHAVVVGILDEVGEHARSHVVDDDDPRP